MDPNEAHAALVALAELVRDMRATQREYFDPSRRRPDTLRRARALEAQVDRAVAEVLGGGAAQRELF